MVVFVYTRDKISLRAPVLRHFALSDFRVWHQQFAQLMTGPRPTSARAGAEFAAAILKYPPSSALPPPQPAIPGPGSRPFEQLLLDALQPASGPTPVLVQCIQCTVHVMKPNSTVQCTVQV
jgi:hypothetical protein